MKSPKSQIMMAVFSQFHHPRGLLGKFVGFIMANRTSNVERNQWTVDLLDIKPGDQVLEIGFGPGLSIGSIAKKLSNGGKVVGIDHSEVMLEQATHRNHQWIVQGLVELKNLKVEEGHLLSGHFNKIFAVNCFMFWDDPVDILKKLFDKMTPNGLIAITHQPRNRGATDDDAILASKKISENLRTAGFDQVRVEVLKLKPFAVCVLGKKM